MAWYKLVSVYNISAKTAYGDWVPVVLENNLGQMILVPHNRGHELFKTMPHEAVGQKVYGLYVEEFLDAEEWPEGSVMAFQGKPFTLYERAILWATAISDIAVATTIIKRWLEGKELVPLGYAHPEGETGLFPAPPSTHMYHELRGHSEGPVVALAYPAPIYRCKVPGYHSWLRHWEEWLAGCAGYDQMEVVPGTLIWDDGKWIHVEDLKGWQDQNPFKVVDPYPKS